MKSPYKVFGTSKELETEKGVRIEYDGFSVTLLRAGGSNLKYQKTLEAKIRPHRLRVQKGTLDPETDRRIMAEVYAEAVIIGWDLTDAKEVKIPFTKENVVKVLLDLPDLFDDIQRTASDLRNFRLEEVEAEAKNSAKS